MTLLSRAVGWLGLAAFALLWAAAGLTGLSLVGGYFWAIVAAVVLVWLRLFWVLRLAVCAGAFAVWHWPIVLCVLLAVPRQILMLPGLVSTGLASWRHPRARWS